MIEMFVRRGAGRIDGSGHWGWDARVGGDFDSGESVRAPSASAWCLELSGRARLY
jgi:hypothetical protein